MSPSHASWSSPSSGERRPAGTAVLVLAVVLLAALFVTTLVTSRQTSTTSRSLARILVNRTCFEAAVSSFAEATSLLGRSMDDKGADLDWKLALLPPYGRPKPRGVLVPRRTREIYGKSHDLEVSDVDVSVVHWTDLSQTDGVIRGQGVIEFAVKVRGERSWIKGGRTVRRRVQFYCRLKPLMDWPPSSMPTGTISRAPATAENSDVVVLPSALATVLEM